jgi:hypothetical protein
MNTCQKLRLVRRAMARMEHNQRMNLQRQCLEAAAAKVPAISAAQAALQHGHHNLGKALALELLFEIFVFIELANAWEDVNRQ